MQLAQATLVVRDYDEAIAFYVGAVGFELADDVDLGGGTRWVVLRPPGGAAALLLARAVDDAQRARVGVDHLRLVVDPQPQTSDDQ